MKYKIFAREFLGSRIRLIGLFIFFIIIFLLMSFSFTMFLSTNLVSTQPDIEMTGRYYDEFRYETYYDIHDVYTELVAFDHNNVLKIYPEVFRKCLTLESSPVERIHISTSGVSAEYLNDIMKDALVEGRLPKESKEIIIGKYFQTYFDLEINDGIGLTPVTSITGDIEMLFNLSLDPNYNEFEDYTIVGVFDDENRNFTILRLLEENMNPNRVLIYNNNPQSKVTSTDILSLLSEKGLSSLIGSLKDNSTSNQSVRLNGTITKILISCVFLSFLFLIILYLTKGLNRKIGILKSLGIKDTILIQMFANCFMILLVLALGVSIIITKLSYYLINNKMKQFYGFVKDKYLYNWDILSFQMIFCIISYVLILLIIKNKTNRTLPKDCMTR